MNGLIAVDESSSATGALVFWRLEGELDPAELAVVWARAGLDTAWLPSTPAPSTALSRAMREHASRRRMLRPLDERGAHALVNEASDGTELSYSVGLKVRLDIAGRPVFDPPDHPLIEQVRADYQKHLETCSADDIGMWLVSFIRRVDGIAMRDRGGIYYVPPAQVARWNAVTACLKQVSGHHTFQIPAVTTSGDAIAAIIEAIEQEASAEAAKMEADLLGDDLGERALQSRVSKCTAVEAKVMRYEALLGAKLDGLRGRLVTLRGNLAAAALMAVDEV